MKIAMLGTRGIPARYGGFETCVEQVSTRLVNRGHQVTVYCRSATGVGDRGSYKGVDLVTLPGFRTRAAGAPLNSLLVTIHSVTSGADILHFFGCGHVPFTLLGRLCGKRVVMTLDGLEWLRQGYSLAARTYLRSFAELAMVFPNKTAADSLSSQKWYSKRTGIEPLYIPYGTDINSSVNREDLQKYNLRERQYIVFVGRLVHEKGLHTLIEAFSGLNTNLQLVVVGDAPGKSQYLEELKTKADPRVRFLGYVYGREFESIRNGACIYVQPSLLEGTSIALLGAMGAGKCIITSDLPENRDVAGESVIYFRTGDPIDLRSKLESALGNPKQMATFANSAKDRASELYNWDKVTDAYEKIYRELAPP